MFRHIESSKTSADIQTSESNLKMDNATDNGMCSVQSTSLNTEMQESQCWTVVPQTGVKAVPPLDSSKASSQCISCKQGEACTSAGKLSITQTNAVGTLCVESDAVMPVQDKGKQVTFTETGTVVNYKGDIGRLAKRRNTPKAKPFNINLKFLSDFSGVSTPKSEAKKRPFALFTPRPILNKFRKIVRLGGNIKEQTATFRCCAVKSRGEAFKNLYATLVGLFRVHLLEYVNDTKKMVLLFETITVAVDHGPLLIKAEVCHKEGERSSSIDIVLRKFMDDDRDVKHEFKEFCRSLHRQLSARFFALEEPAFKISTDIKMI